MGVKHYTEGEVLFSEGEPSTTVLRILAGAAEVTKRVDEREVLLGRIGTGEFVGEMGVILNRQRGATVRVTEAVTAEELDKTEFLARIADDSATAFQLLLRLSERLNALDLAFAEAVSGGAAVEALADDVPPAPVQPIDSPTGLVLKPASDQLAKAMPEAGLAIGQLPFTVGRTPRRAEPPPRMPVHLVLDDRTPFRLSRAHFQIETGRGGLRVRDLGSVLGTQVNGRPIGRYFGADAAALQDGDNTIVAGGDDSPFSFELSVRPV